ncbi:hypothetical protein [Nocardia brasiliensis]|uniref:hypothetical protein n=1 Tax=Nocardia brasiliensis TaxID=37326 RepID=UPI003D8F8886
MLAAEAAGVDTRDWNPIAGTVEPRPGHSADYDSYYQHYRELYERNTDIAHFLASEQHRTGASS